jgi:hypothetical protein
MKPAAVIGSVVESQQLPPAVGAVLRQVGVSGKLAPQIEESEPEIVERLPVLDLTGPPQPPGPLPSFSIRFLELQEEAGDGSFLSLPLNSLGAADPILLGTELLFLFKQG